MNFRLYGILFFLTILSSCNKDDKPKLVEGFISDNLEIPILEAFNPDRTRSQYYESDTGEYLAILNKTNFSIGIFDLKKKTLAKSIPLTKEGPNGIGLDNGFLIVSMDTLLVATIPPRIRVLNFTGELVETISIENSMNDVNFLSSTNEVPFLYSGQTLFGIQPFIDNFFNITEEDATLITPIFTVDFSNSAHSVEWLPINRPEGFWKEGKKDENLSWTERGDSIIVAPYTDHRLWVISKSKRKLLSITEAKSTYVTEFHILNKSDMGGDKGIIKSLESARYEIIMFDKYRDVFYRIFFPKIEVDTYNFTPRELFSHRPKIGVQILDGKLSLIGEHFFEDHQVQTWNYFVGRKGLYVSTNNPNREDFDENFLRYDIIRFEGLEYEE